MLNPQPDSSVADCVSLRPNLEGLARPGRMAQRPLQGNVDQPLAPPPSKQMRSGAALPAFFLRTKLLPPRPAPALLPRPRLTERLQQNLAHAVTLVAAPAGSGKTTLVA